MSDHCCAPEPLGTAVPESYRRALRVALVANAAMFAVEVVAGLKSDSVSLLADAIDFAGDAANYALSLAVLGLAAAWQSRAALVKGLAMGGYGLFVLGRAAWNLVTGAVPDASTMGWIGLLALGVNAGVAWMLFAYRDGNANMRSVWLCSRNDAIGNLAVLAAAAGVGWLSAGWPDVLVAVLIGTLGLTSSRSVILRARDELRQVAT